MKKFQCKCGVKLGVKPEMAGKVIVTPCCKRRVKIPSAENRRSNSERISVQCSCGQKISLPRPSGPIKIACPTCKKQMQLGTPQVKPQGPLPFPEKDFSNDPFSDPFAAPPTQLSQRYYRAKKTKKKTGKKRKRNQTKTRIPRYGWISEESGIPALISVGFLLFASMVGLGSYLVAQARTNMAKATASETWQATDGRILNSDIQVRGLTRRKRRATVTVSFQYNVGEQSYTGNKLSFEKQDSFQPEAAEELLRPYPSGATCTVYYNPDNPADSVLLKGARGSNTINLMVGVFFAIAGIATAADCWIGAFNARNG